MFHELNLINTRPGPFEFYTADRLWTDPHIAQKMLGLHLDDSVDAASRSGKFIDRSAKWIIGKFGLDGGASVVDFGCGPGLYTVRFAAAGADVTGIDFSKNSLDYAVKKANENSLKIDYVHADYLDYSPDLKFDLVTMIMCDFTALSPIQRKSLLLKFHDLLKPGGSVLLDVYSLAYFNGKNEQAVYGFNSMNGFWSRDVYYCFLNTFRYENEKVLLDKYTIYTAKETIRIYNWAQCYDREAIADEFDSAGLRVVEFFGDVSGRAYDDKADEFAVVAQKK